MSEETPRVTLDSALGFAANFLGPLTSAISRSDALRDARAGLARADPSAFDATAAAQVARQVAGVFDTPLAEVLGEVWRKNEEVRAFCGRPAGEPELVEVTEHAAEWKKELGIELVVAGAVLATFRFGVSVGFALKGGILVIDGGRFLELRTGEVELAATLTCEEREVKRCARTVPLPHGLSFGRGIPICPERREAEPEPSVAVIPAGEEIPAPAPVVA